MAVALARQRVMRARPLRVVCSRAASSSSTPASFDIAVEADLKAKTLLKDSEEGTVAFAPTKVAWKPRPTCAPSLILHLLPGLDWMHCIITAFAALVAHSPPYILACHRGTQKVAVETSRLFCASNDPLQHTEADVGRFFQLDDSTTAFERVFYHTGFCGEQVEARAQRLKTSAMMVRAPGVALRDELLQLDASNGLGGASGLVLNGGVGVGKSSVLNYTIAALHSAGWLVAVFPHAADWTLGLSARSAQHANEAYRIDDPNFFTQVPPELEGSELHESPDASAHFLISFYLSQHEKLSAIPIKGVERRKHYADAATDPSVGPTLADMLRAFVSDTHNAFSEFPMPARPMYDLLAELQSVTEFPTAMIVDGWNRWDQMATSCRWRSRVPLHSKELLVPSLLGADFTYGAKMQRGVMLCATTHAGAKPPGVPRALRKRVPPPQDWHDPHSLAPDTRQAVRMVRPYSRTELQNALDMYALLGHLRNAELAEQLRTDELATKVHMLTAGVAEDVFRVCEQM
jgi:hypothetical protein